MSELKEVLIEDSDGDPVYQIFYKGEMVFEWHDWLHIDRPEDLTWSRMIGGVFYDGVKLGKRITKEQSE